MSEIKLKETTNVLPKIILHNSISLDGSYMNFEVNMGLHYQIAGNYKPDAHLIGSNTMKVGLDMYSGKIPQEELSDFEKQNKDKNLPYWIIIDTKGCLRGLLHILRRFQLCKEVIILISEETRTDYIKYLKERKYDYYIGGKDCVDLERAIIFLKSEYNLKTILTDTGRKLGNILLNQGLVNEVSLLVHPVILGEKSENLFRNVNSDIVLKKVKCQVLNYNYVWMAYKVIK